MSSWLPTALATWNRTNIASFNIEIVPLTIPFGNGEIHPTAWTELRRLLPTTLDEHWDWPQTACPSPGAVGEALPRKRRWC